MELSENTKEILADFLNEIRDYIHESDNNLVNDERSSREFVDIYCADFSGDKSDYTSNSGLTIPSVSDSLDWFKKDRLAGIKLNEMRVNAVKTSILFEISSKILRRLIIEGIDIGLNYR